MSKHDVDDRILSVLSHSNVQTIDAIAEKAGYSKPVVSKALATLNTQGKLTMLERRSPLGRGRPMKLYGLRLDNHPQFYDLEVWARYITPVIERVIRVPAHTSPYSLHMIFQTAFGFEDAHEFDILYWDTNANAAVEVSAEDDWFSLASTPSKSNRYLYEYDMGDRWQFVFDIINVGMTPDEIVPRIISGKRAGPPEDCGGVDGYEELLRTINGGRNTPKDGGWSYRRDLITQFEPDHFDIDKSNEQLRSLFKSVRPRHLHAVASSSNTATTQP